MEKTKKIIRRKKYMQENKPNPEKTVKPYIFYQRGVFLSILFVKVFFCE